MSYKVAMLIPTTTRERNWKSITDTDLYKINIKSFLLSYCPEHSYTYYLGIDDDDPIFSQQAEKEKLQRFVNIMKNVSLQFVSMKGIKKGHLTTMWNRLFTEAYHDGCDYFYQCGDDIQFINKGWVSQSIKLLKLYHGYGVTGPLDKMQYRVHTQSFVSRKHYELFGVYFPNQIINWFCDDWITKIYYEDLLYPLLDYWCMNVGGAARYVTPKQNKTYDNQKQICDKLIIQGRNRISKVLQDKGVTFPKHEMAREQEEMKIGYAKNEQEYGEMVTKTYKNIMQKIVAKNKKLGIEPYTL